MKPRHQKVLKLSTAVSPPLLWGRPMVVVLLLVLITFALYWPMRQFDFIRFDDGKYVTANPQVQRGLTWGGVRWAFTTSEASNWHPVTWLSHMADCQFFGPTPGAAHLHNAILHALNVALLFLLLRRMTGTVWRSALVAALFAWHPLRVESVAWVAERKDLLSGCFLLLTLRAYVEFATKSKIQDPKVKVWYAGALACFALGLLTKPMLVTLPFVLLLLDYWPLQRFTGLRPPVARWLEKVPFFILAAAACVATLIAQRRGGSTVSLAEFPLDLRAANALVSYLRYVGKIFWPENLAVFYPHPHKWPIGLVVVAGCFVLAISTIAIFRAQRRPYLFLGWFWFVGMLIPVIGLVQVGSQSMADRYTYLPGIGILIAFVWGCAEWAGQRRRVPAAAFVVVLLALCVWRSSAQLQHWRNTETLFTHAISVTRDNAVAYNNLGAELYEQGRDAEAFTDLKEALRLRPVFADAYVNLGQLFKRQGKLPDAMAHFEAAWRINPKDVETLNHLAVVIESLGKTNEAIALYREALHLQPEFEPAHANLADALAAGGNLEAAVTHYRAALRQDSERIATRYNLACALMRSGDLKAAAAEFEAVLHREPEHFSAHNNLACVRAAQDRFEDAASQFQHALRLRPDDPEALNNFGSTLLEMGRSEEAERHLRRAATLKPDYPSAHYNLGNALARRKKYSDAIHEYETALRLQPDFAEAHCKLGNTLLAQGHTDDAARHYAAALERQPAYAEAHHQLGMIQLHHRAVATGIAHFREAVRLRPDWVEALNNLAWVLSTHPDEQYRNGTRAVVLAKRAVELSRTNDAAALDTLSVALAETGQFAAALATARKAAAIADSSNDQPLAAEIADRLRQFEKAEPFRSVQD